VGRIELQRCHKVCCNCGNNTVAVVALLVAVVALLVVAESMDCSCIGIGVELQGKWDH